MAGRYDGKPLVKLMDCYVLWAIGELSDEDASLLEKATPKLQEIYGKTGNWQEVLSSELGFANNPTSIREHWLMTRRDAKKNHVVMTPLEFAQMVVDGKM